MRSVGVVLVTALVAVIGWLVWPSDSAAEAVRPGPSSLTLEGRGYGHGRGMSQYGAQGAAAQHGKNYRQILRFYYPGTRVASARGSLRILITNSGANVEVEDVEGLRVRKVGTDRTHRLKEAGARRWRLSAAPGGGTTVSVRTDAWEVVRTVSGEAEFVADRPLTLLTSAGARRYQGALRSAVVGGARATVNVVSLEHYLRGVVPREVPALWDPQAVRAQSVAARTYAVFERSERRSAPYDLCDTSLCQVYGGLEDAHPASDQAIRATAHQVLHADGKPAFTQFSASNGGWTVKGSMPYLTARQDPWDRWSGNPNRAWTVAVPAPTIEAAYPGVGDFQRIDVRRRDGHGAWGGRVLKVKVIGAAGAVTVTGEEFRSALGLRSSWFRST